MIKAICIDDKNKPAIIPNNKWVKEGTQYHIIHIYRLPHHDNLLGVHLKEITLEDIPDCEFKTYRLSRFGIDIKDLEKFLELAKECAGLNDVDFTELAEEQIYKEEDLVEV